MCSICLQVPCNSRCPNAPEPEAVYRCLVCGEGIFQQQKYFETAKGNICDECIEDMSAVELLEIMEERMEVANGY